MVPARKKAIQQKPLDINIKHIEELQRFIDESKEFVKEAKQLLRELQRQAAQLAGIQ